MKTAVTGVTATITNKSDLAVLAELVSRIDYETLDAACDDALTISKQEFEEFIARTGNGLQGIGLLNEELQATGIFSESK